MADETEVLMAELMKPIDQGGDRADVIRIDVIATRAVNIKRQCRARHARRELRDHFRIVTMNQDQPLQRGLTHGRRLVRWIEDLATVATEPMDDQRNIAP